MLISESMQNIIRVLLNKKVKSVRELSKEANTSLGITSKIVNQLKISDYISKRFEIKNKKRLLDFFAYSFSINELERIEFVAAERPQYIIKKIANIAIKNDLEYAFTLFSATEIIKPYVAPSETHFYILEEEKDEWERILPKNNILPSQRGNVLLLIVDRNYFYNMRVVDGIKVVSLSQLYADLMSYKGRGEDAARELIENV
ncbi:MAG: hypothetical protein H8D38_05970 [DPANN group archaeon]|nr:hypothetical protein [DPANN group archaeon]